MASLAYDITIAVHCWRYSRLLAYQLGSLIRWRPKCQVLVRIFVADEDKPTLQTFRWYRDCQPPSVDMTAWRLPLGMLKNRSIGRNIAAMHADDTRLLYFSDCDYVFGPGYLDAVSEKVTDEMPVAYPQWLHKCEPFVGDDYVDNAEPGKLMTIDTDEFHPERLRKAIGGVQIVPWRIAKKYGYLPDSKRHQAEAANWKKTTSDVSWRKGVCREEGVANTGVGLELPPVYRIRHSECGRDNHDLVM